MSHIHLLIFDNLLSVNSDECQTPTCQIHCKKYAKILSKIETKVSLLLSLSALCSLKESRAASAASTQKWVYSPVTSVKTLSSISQYTSS